MNGNREALGKRLLVLEEQYKMAVHFTRIPSTPELNFSDHNSSDHTKAESSICSLLYNGSFRERVIRIEMLRSDWRPDRERWAFTEYIALRTTTLLTEYHIDP